jgi:hypothetical protein
MEFAASALASFAAAAPVEAASVYAMGSTVVPVIGATGAAASAGAAIGAGGAGLAGAIGATSQWAGILSGGATVASVLAARRAGELDARMLEFAADDAMLERKIEEIKGIDRRNTIKAKFIETVGERDVAYAASGIDLTFGTPAIARTEAVRDTERALNVDRATEDLRRSRLLERAAVYRYAASQAREGSLFKAAGLALEGGARFLRRG